MNRTPSNAALAILLSGATLIAPVFGQESKPAPGATLQYVGANTRIGIGVDSENDVRGELFHVFSSRDQSATLGELWAGRHAGGAKLSHHWTASGAAVNKLFVAFDQGQDDARKATFGGGQEYERWFWNTYLSKGLSGARLAAITSSSSIATLSGTDAGRPYEEDVTTVVTNKTFQKAYDWGVGARAGHFYENHLLRVTAGLDYEWGKYASRQWTGSLTAEKFFAGSPISIALSGEINRRNGDFEGSKNDRRGYVMLRYELGAPQSSFRPSKITRTISSTERVQDPNWKPPVAAAVVAAAAPVAVAAKPAEPSFRMEKRTSRANSGDAQETYFDLGSAKLKPAAHKELDALVARIEAQRPYVELKINIIGHTCPTGSDRNNYPLSNKRAAAVKAYLVSKGIPANLVSAEGKAGKAPKYPEVKGQSFRNRRADTDVLIVKEKTEDVRVPVAASTAAPATAPAVPVAPVSQVTPPTIERAVQREVVEDVPNNWIARALHNTAQHKTRVDSYRWLETSSAQSTGPRRYLNRGPAAVNDSYSVDCQAATTLNVLVNDTDPDGDALSITSVTSPGKGSAAIVAGKVVYTSNAASCAGGTDSFTYTISDGKGSSSTATVSITIAPPPNNPPVAIDDSYVVPCRSTYPLDVLSNDRDPNGDPLMITSITQPTKASIAIAADGKSLTYTPGPACFTRDTFTYTISDGKGGTATATVTLIDP